MKILVTRPQPDGTALAERLKGAGHEAVLEPLMLVAHFGGDVSLEGAQAIAFTSANGVRALAAVSSVRDLPVFAVGAATGAAARREGYKFVHVAGGDVTHLAARVGSALDPEDGSIVHIAGTVTAGDLQGMLASFGFQIDRHVLYEAKAAEAFSEALAAEIRAGGVDGVVLYSPRTARIFTALIEKAGHAQACQAMTCYCLSDNVADAVAALVFADCLVAAAPTEDDLMDLLEKD